MYDDINKKNEKERSVLFPLLGLHTTNEFFNFLFHDL